MANPSFSVNFNGTLVELGEKQVFNFLGTLGDRLFFDSIDADSSYDGISYRLINPSGYTVFSDAHG